MRQFFCNAVLCNAEHTCLICGTGPPLGRTKRQNFLLLFYSLYFSSEFNIDNRIFFQSVHKFLLKLVNILFNICFISICQVEAALIDLMLRVFFFFTFTAGAVVSESQLSNCSADCSQAMSFASSSLISFRQRTLSASASNLIFCKSAILHND